MLHASDRRLWGLSGDAYSLHGCFRVSERADASKSVSLIVRNAQDYCILDPVPRHRWIWLLPVALVLGLSAYSQAEKPRPFSLWPSSISLAPGQTQTLTATSVAKTWTSSHPSVAAVSPLGATTARVTAVGAGTAVISAKNGPYTALATVTVSAAAPEPPPGAPSDVSLIGTVTTDMVDNPTSVRFAASTDHGTLTRYERRTVQVSNGVVLETFDVGLPTPVGGLCQVSLSLSKWISNEIYRVDVRSVRLPYTSAWVQSSQTARLVGQPPEGGPAFYVATTGSNSNPGTLTQPFRTIAYGVSKLSPGITLLVRGGTYVESLGTNAVPSGTSWSSPVRIAAYPSETVWMRPGTVNRVLDFGGSQRYIEFDRINLDGTNVLHDNVKINGSSSSNNAHHIRIKNAELIGTTRLNEPNHQFGVIVTAQTATIIGGNEFINLVVHGGGPSDFSHNFYIQSSNNLVEHCTMYNAAGNGVQIYNGYGHNNTSNNIVRYNVIRDITRPLGRHRGVIVSRGNNNQIYGNLIYNIQGTNTPTAGIEVFSSSSQNTKIYNNTIFNTNGRGIQIDTGASGTVVRNNIAYQSDTGNYLDNGTNTVQSNNVFSSNPLFVNSGASNFHLQAGSPARNTGTFIALVNSDIDSTVRPQEGSLDIGAYEYVP